MFGNRTITPQETVTHHLLFILQPNHLHNLYLGTSSQPITSHLNQRLLYLLTNQIAQDYDLTLHRLSKGQSPITVLLRTPITRMIFFNQGVTPGFKLFSKKTLPWSFENVLIAIKYTIILIFRV